MKILAWLFGAVWCISVFAFPHTVRAFEMKSGDSVDVSPEQTVNGSLFAGGNTVTIDGVVHGDVYCAGQKVTISGTVDGDVICAGQSLSVSGNIGGSVRVTGQSLDLTGTIARNVTLLGQSITLAKQSSVSGELLIGGQSLSLNGMVGRDIGGFAQSITVNGEADGNIHVQSESLSIGKDAVIRGNLTYISDTKAAIAPGAQVSGKTEQVLPRKNSNTDKTKMNRPIPVWPANAIPSILFFLIVAFLAVRFFSKSTVSILDLMRETPVPTVLTGFVALMVVPFTALILFVTVIGIPFALLLILLFIISIAVSRIYAAILVGWYILDSFHAKEKKNMLLQMLIGVPILWFMFKAPLVGGLIGFLAVIWGLGGMIRSFQTRKK